MNTNAAPKTRNDRIASLPSLSDSGCLSNVRPLEVRCTPATHRGDGPRSTYESNVKTPLRRHGLAGFLQPRVECYRKTRKKLQTGSHEGFATLQRSRTQRRCQREPNKRTGRKNRAQAGRRGTGYLAGWLENSRYLKIAPPVTAPWHPPSGLDRTFGKIDGGKSRRLYRERR